MSSNKMEAIEYLENIVCFSEVKSLENLDLTTILGVDLNVRLWNLCVKLNAKGYKGTQLGSMRKHACENMEQRLNAKDMAKYWARTAKEFVDSKDYDLAKLCFDQISLNDSDSEAQFNILLWQVELKSANDEDYTLEIYKLTKFSKEMPQEKFRLARFLHCELAKSCYNKKDFNKLKDIVECCLEVCQGPGPPLLNEIAENAKLLLVEVDLHKYDFEHARTVLKSLPETAHSMYGWMRIAIQEDDYQGIDNLLSKMAETLRVEDLMKAVDILQANNKLVDSCKALMLISAKHSNEAVNFRWASTLFTLFLMNDTLDQSLQYLNIKYVINQLIRTHSENTDGVRNVIWDFSVELLARGNYREVLDLIDNCYLRIVNKDNEENALVLCGKCYIYLNDPINALNCVQDIVEQEDAFIIKMIARLEMGNADFSVIKDNILKLSSNKVLDFVEILLSCDIDIENTLRLLNDSLIEKIPECEEIGPILAALCKNVSEIPVLLHYIQLAHEKVDDIEILSWFFALSWNQSLEYNTQPLGYDLILCAYHFSEKLNDEMQLPCLISAFRIAKSCQLHDQLDYILTELKKYTISDHLVEEINLITVEMHLLLKRPIYIPDYPLEFLRQIAELCFQYQDTEQGITCIDILLNNVASPKERFSLCRSLLEVIPEYENCEKYINLCLQLYDEETIDLTEVEWIVSMTWNKGARALGVNNLELAIQWIKVAKELAEISRHPLSDKITFTYESILLPLQKS